MCGAAVLILPIILVCILVANLSVNYSIRQVFLFNIVYMETCIELNIKIY